MIRKTIFAVSTEESRPIFTGCLFEIKNNKLNVVAVDGFRLAWKSKFLQNSSNDFTAVIPGRTLNELLKILTDNEESIIKIGVNKNQALFEIDSSILVSRIIEGEFLNYNSIIPESYNTRVKIKTKNLLDSFERVALFARENKEKDKKSPVKMKATIDGVTLSCISDAGDAKEGISAFVEGSDIEVGFNPRYVIEALKVIDDSEIYVEFNSNISPVLLKPVNGNEFIYVVLPIKLKND